jgi:hypothetical protein
VQAKAITVVATGTDKVYDGTLGITAGLDSSGIVSGDSVSFAGSATLLDKNVGTGKTVAVTGISASGVDAGNYSYGTTASTTANVTPKPLTVEATGVNKTYDGTTTASVTLDSAGIVSGDQVGFSGVAAYGDKNVGTGKAVNVSGIASNGSDAFNYTVSNTTATTTATVERLGIQVTATGVDKVYDGALNTPVLLASGDIVSGDQVDITGLGLLADKNVGTGKPVTVSDLALGGADGGNYSLILTTVSTTTNVTPRPISVALIGAVGKTDTGSATVNLSFDNYAISNLVAGETLLLQGQGTFTDTSVGTGKNVATTVNLGDYIALESDTLPSNYALFTGPLSAPIGEVMASSNYQAALQSLPSIPTGDRLAIAGHEATTLLGGGGLLSEEGNTVSTANGEDKKKEDHVGDHSNRTRDISLRRRNLALSQGGIRLPSGLAQDQ